MPRYGIALAECVQPEHDRTLRALDAFAERSRMPDLVPLWAREWQVDPRLLASIRERGAEPVLYVETATPTIPVDTLLRFADAAAGAVIRINQEPDGHWGAPWHSWSPEVYTAYWDVCHVLLGPLFWCPSIPRRAHEAGYWPGEADIVGFDRYVWKSDDWPAQQFPRSIAQCEVIAPGVPVWVGEHGSLAGTTRRAEKLRQVGTIEGLDVVVLMNLVAEQPTGGFDDWRWTRSMDRAFVGMVTT